MSAWKFAESEEDGRTWMQKSQEINAFIDIRMHEGESWRRIMVVTKGWLERHLAEVGTDAGRAVFAAMLVLPDLAPERLREAIDAAVLAGGLAHFAMPLE